MDIDAIKKEIELKNNKSTTKFNLDISNLNNFDLINKELFLKAPLFYDEYKIWWAWDEKKGLWNQIDETSIYIKFNNVFNLVAEKSPFISSVKATVFNALKEAGRRYKENYLKDIKKTWVAFKDCFYDIEDQKVIDKDKTYFCNNVIPYNYKNITCTDTPTIDKYFKDWVGNTKDGKDWSQTLWEIMAYCILPDYPLDFCFALVGTGSNGKSTFLNFLIKFIDFGNCTTSDFDLLTTNRFECGRLYKKLVCLMGEIDDTVFSKTALFKRLLGKDMLRGEYKNKTPFDFFNYAKLIIATNTLPMTTDKTKGFYRRWIVIDFPYEFDTRNGDVLKQIPEEEFERLPLKLINILKEIFKNKAFTNQGTVEDRMNRYESKANPVNSFLKEYCEKDINGYIPVFEFYDTISPYLDNKGYKHLSKLQISKIMKDMGFESEVKRLTIKNENKSWRCYSGIKWIGKLEYNYNNEDNIFESIEIKNIDEKEKITFDELIKKLNIESKSIEDQKEFIKKLKKQGVIAEVRYGEYILIGGMV